MRLTTTDLYESGYLHCAGAQLSDVLNERNRNSTVIFVFDDCKQSEGRLEELQKNYHNGTATVNLSDYRRSVETLKDMMFRILRNENQKGVSTPRNRRNRNGHQIIRRNKKVS